MNRFTRLPAALTAVVLLPVPAARADYLDDVGYRKLAAELGAAMPDGAGVSVSHVEAPHPTTDGYLPEPGSGSFPGTIAPFAGKTFTARSGAAVASFHAGEVAGNFYSNANTFGRLSLSPGVTTVDCWRAISQPSGSTSSWITDLIRNGSTAQPDVQSRAVENHSWVIGGNGNSTLNDICRRLDFMITRDRFLCVCGVTNDSMDPTPALLASAFNNLAVGRSDGVHSRGGTPSAMDGPGRLKPELVAPLDFTSYSTALTSSAGALLRQKANSIGTTNSRAPQTLKAVLLAGATREEFPGWTKTATVPLDAVYGTGELNIYNSWHILSGGEQAADLATSRPARAWDLTSMSPNGTDDYRFTVPAGSFVTEMSAVAVWHSTITDSNNSPSVFAPTRDTLANINLTLFRDPSGGGEEMLDASSSTIFNLEHVRAAVLPPGKYRLRLSRSSAAGNAVDAAIAWRYELADYEPGLSVAGSAGNLVFSMTGLLAGLPHVLETSTDLQTWAPLESFTPAPAAPSRQFTLVMPADVRRFYRLTSGSL